MAAANLLSEKVQNLPLLCVETILNFTPTSKLIRLCSIAVPLPGAFWSLGLETVLKKRLPLSLRDDLSCYFGYADDNARAIFDNTGAKIGTVKKPDMFRFCPLREFIQSATLIARFRRTVRRALFSPCDDDPLLGIVHGDALLSHMPNVVHLALVVRRTDLRDEVKHLFEPCLKHLLPQLQSFEVSISSDCCNMGIGLAVDVSLFAMLFVTLVQIDEMSCLRRLALPEASFDYLVRASSNPSARLQAVLAGLSSLCIEHNVVSDHTCIDSAALNFISLHCGHLSQLQVVVRREFRAYLEALRTLQCLTSLGLHVLHADLTGLTFDGSWAISSVSDLRIVCNENVGRTRLFKIATLFPNARAVALKADDRPYIPMELATPFFGERQLFPAVEKLSCFYSGVGEMVYCKSGLATPFLDNPHLPETVDLSQLIFEQLGRDANLLTAIFCAMQASSVKSLLLRGPIYREALPRLQSHIDLNGDNATVSAWKDRNLGEQPGNWIVTNISQQTDFKITGLKTSGNLNGERFTIRIFHQLAKRVDIMD